MTVARSKCIKDTIRLREISSSLICRRYFFFFNMSKIFLLLQYVEDISSFLICRRYFFFFFDATSDNSDIDDRFTKLFPSCMTCLSRGKSRVALRPGVFLFFKFLSIVENILGDSNQSFPLSSSIWEVEINAIERHVFEIPDNRHDSFVDCR